MVVKSTCYLPIHLYEQMKITTQMYDYAYTLAEGFAGLCMVAIHSAICMYIQQRNKTIKNFEMISSDSFLSCSLKYSKHSLFLSRFYLLKQSFITIVVSI